VHESAYGTEAKCSNVRFCAACGGRAEVLQTGQKRRE
jgi:hypothetical protein